VEGGMQREIEWDGMEKGMKKTERNGKWNKTE
jgi:hypothetical protein